MKNFPGRMARPSRGRQLDSEPMVPSREPIMVFVKGMRSIDGNREETDRDRHSSGFNGHARGRRPLRRSKCKVIYDFSSFKMNFCVGLPISLEKATKGREPTVGLHTRALSCRPTCSRACVTLLSLHQGHRPNVDLFQTPYNLHKNGRLVVSLGL